MRDAVTVARDRPWANASRMRRRPAPPASAGRLAPSSRTPRDIRSEAGPARNPAVASQHLQGIRQGRRIPGEEPRDHGRWASGCVPHSVPRMSPQRIHRDAQADGGQHIGQLRRPGRIVISHVADGEQPGPRDASSSRRQPVIADAKPSGAANSRAGPIGPARLRLRHCRLAAKPGIGAGRRDRSQHPILGRRQHGRPAIRHSPLRHRQSRPSDR